LRRGQSAELQLSPSRMIAPVGSEVVLLAGLCGADGYFVTCQPVEWTLSQDSTGHFVEVGSQGRPWYARLVGRAPKKVSGSYATGTTSCATEVITRGTTDPNDDVSLLRGQTWISVTSASEGTSRVTCMARRVESWDHRKQTATIHWIDAQWVFPAPIVARAGQSHILATTITRRTSPAPVVGWKVRYEIVDGPPARLGVEGSSVAEVDTDAFGKAAVPIVGATTQPGVTRVRIQVIRPPAPGDGLARQVVGEGFVTVTWSASGLAVAVAGPPTAEVDQKLTYQVNVSNPGDLAARDVLVIDELPPGLRFVGGTPSGYRQFGNRVEWHLGEIGPRQARALTIECVAQTAGEITHCVKARSGEGVEHESCAITRVISNALQLQMTGPPTAVVGQEVTYNIVLTNRGRQPLTGLRLQDTYDPGFQHSIPSPIKRLVGPLAPGEERKLEVSFTIVRPGQLCHTLQITADGGHSAVQRACLTAHAAPAQPRPAPQTQPAPEPEPARPAARPEMTVEKTAPTQSRVGQTVEFRILVRNVGPVAITGIRIADEYPSSLQPVAASLGRQVIERQIVWTVERLLPGESTERLVRCECVEVNPNACNRVTVTADGGLQEEDQACVRIQRAIPPPEVPRTDGVPPRLEEPTIEPPVPPTNGRTAPTDEPRPAAAGELRLIVAAFGDPVKVGEKIRFSVALENDRTSSDKNVRLMIKLPEGVKYERIIDLPPLELSSVSGDARTLKMRPIAEMRAGETIRFMVEVLAARAGKYTFVGEVDSLLSPETVTAEEDLTINVE
jgi:uncharacterized repeat protein (TIGR01451 family)